MSPRSDPYLYPGTTVLINKFDLRDQRRLDEIEANYTSLRLSDLSENPMTGNYDINHLCSMHRYIFSDLYAWAGVFRTIDIEKAEPVLGGISIEYCPHSKIEHTLEKYLKEMQAINWLKLPRNEQAEGFSKYFALIWQIHPFREGNTRTVTHFCCQYADSVNMMIDRQVFQRNSEYLRSALVAARAVFYDLGDRSQPQHLYRIVLHALS